ncbi:MAG: hypothetical protein SOW78_10730 [Clostridia bacterium]|nr:hypothetical protein [Clostridia bacterium]
MPEKKNGMMYIIREVFRMKKPCCGDIVYQSDKVISDYIVRRRNEIINKYNRKKHPVLKFFAFCLFVGAAYAAYRLFW